MYEVKPKKSLDFNEEVTVNISLKELAILYSLLCYTTTSDVQSKVDKKIGEPIDVYEGDAPYRLYESTCVILRNNGVKAYT